MWSKNHHHHGFMTKWSLKKVPFFENFTTQTFLEQSALLPPKLKQFLLFLMEKKVLCQETGSKSAFSKFTQDFLPHILGFRITPGCSEMLRPSAFRLHC